MRVTKTNSFWLRFMASTVSRVSLNCVQMLIRLLNCVFPSLSLLCAFDYKDLHLSCCFKLIIFINALANFLNADKILWSLLKITKIPVCIRVRYKNKIQRYKFRNTCSDGIWEWSSRSTVHITNLSKFILFEMLCLLCIKKLQITDWFFILQFPK